MKAPWEIGSEFHWDSVYLKGTPMISPSGAKLFARGVGALMALMIQEQKGGVRPRLHLPSYFCIDVAKRLTSVCDVLWFRDLPTQSFPDFSTLKPRAGDFVLALNYFGQWDNARWRNFDKSEGVKVIEDHSHDPLSDWAQLSVADYALASLRKTLPVPDGAWLWSPVGLQVPDPIEGESIGPYKKLAAMNLKSEYLNGRIFDKEVFRELQIEGEQLLDSPPLACASKFSGALLAQMGAGTLRTRRIANITRFKELLDQKSRQSFKLLRPIDAASDGSFNPVLLCASNPIRDGLRSHLRENSVFAPNHWPQDASTYHSNDSQAVALSERLLTMPIDFRYSTPDVDMLFEILDRYNPK